MATHYRRPVAGPTDVVSSFDHVSVAVADIESSLTLMELIGAEYLTGGDLPEQGFRWVHSAMPGGVKLELIAPLEPDDAGHFLNTFLRDRGPGVHHFTFRVENLLEAVDVAQARGFTVVGIDTEHDWKEAFIHPKPAEGVLMQLAEWSEEAPFLPLEEVLSDASKEKPS